jgi:hypothetical protein
VYGFREKMAIFAGIMNTDKQEDEYVDLINNTFNNDLLQHINGVLDKGHVYELGMPGEALMSRLDYLPIQMAASTLALKHGNANAHSHPFDLNELFDLPQKLAHPVAVFESETDPNKTVVLTALKDSKGCHFIVIISVRKVKNANLIEDVNSVISLYPKDSAVRIARWFASTVDHTIGRNLIGWIDHKKALDWLTDHSADLRAAGLSFKSVAKVIQNFNNPTTNKEKSAETIRIRPHADPTNQHLMT